MGIYIKGMEMPKSCMTCLFQTPYMGGWCFLLDGNSNAYSKRCDCPLIPVPKHGSLIDKNALINALQELFDRRYKDAVYTGCRDASVSWNDAICYIKNAPTIIEAKECE